jgi:ferredoxin
MSDAGGLGLPKFERPGDGTGAETRQDFRWLMSSDVCKHCTHAGCLDVCPTGALFRTEFGTVVVPPGAKIRCRRQQPHQGHYIGSVLGRCGRSKSVNSAHRASTFRRRKPAR